MRNLQPISVSLPNASILDNIYQPEPTENIFTNPDNFRFPKSQDFRNTLATQTIWQQGLNNRGIVSPTQIRDILAQWNSDSVSSIGSNFTAELNAIGNSSSSQRVSPPQSMASLQATTSNLLQQSRTVLESSRETDFRNRNTVAALNFVGNQSSTATNNINSRNTRAGLEGRLAAKRRGQVAQNSRSGRARR